MTLDTLLTVIFLVLAGVCAIGYRVSQRLTYLEYQDQKVGGRK